MVMTTFKTIKLYSFQMIPTQAQNKLPNKNKTTFIGYNQEPLVKAAPAMSIAVASHLRTMSSFMPAEYLIQTYYYTDYIVRLQGFQTR